MRGLVIGMVLAAASARAAPVDPARLEPIVPAVVPGAGPATAVWAVDVDTDVVLATLAPSFAMLAGTQKSTGRIGDQQPATEATVFATLAPASAIRLPKSRGWRAVDVAFRAAGPLEVLRFLADAAGASYVFAPQHVLPEVTVSGLHVDPRETAQAVAKLAGLELSIRGKLWIVTEPHPGLDAAVVSRTERGTRVEIDHARAGEARRLLEPHIADDQCVCPKDTSIDASLHGETGALQAVLATIHGPPCEHQPNTAELDTATAQLVGILVGPKARRAVFRVPHGARVFQPGTATDAQRVEIDHVIVHPGESASLAPIQGSSYVAPGPFEAPDETSWQLRGVVRTGASWHAIFRSKTEWRIVGAPAEITAGTARSVVGGKSRGYALER